MNTFYLFIYPSDITPKIDFHNIYKETASNNLHTQKLFPVLISLVLFLATSRLANMSFNNYKINNKYKYICAT